MNKNPRTQKTDRPLLRMVCEVLGKAFPSLPFFRDNQLAKMRPKKRSPKSALRPQNPATPDLYESRKPFGRGHEPRTLDEALERRRWNERRVEDWRTRDRNYGRQGKTLLWDRVAEEVRNGTYRSRAHTYEGRVESVMGAAARELIFIKRWIQRYEQRQESERRRRHRERLAARNSRNNHLPPSRPFRAARPPGRPHPRRHRRPAGAPDQE